MRVLFCNRPKSFWQGGDYFQMEKTAEALRELGVEVDITEEYVVKPEVIELYDIVHLWNFSMIWTKYQLWVARKHKKPVVCSMIYHESDEFIPYNLQQIMLNELSAQIYLTESEKERVIRRLQPIGETYVIPNGIDSFWFKDTKIAKEDIVLTVGRIEPNKGQLAVARVCNKLGIPYYCIGELKDPNYGDELLAEHAILLDKKEPNELIQWYARAKVFALVSKAEIFPLTVMEAMAQNCQIVLTTTSEWKPKVQYASYGNLDHIEEAIQECLETNIDYKTAIKAYTWTACAEQIKQIYEKIVNNK